MKKILPLLMVMITSVLYAQLEIVSVTPANNATNVPLKTTVTITFNKAVSLDAFEPLGNVFTNINVEGEPSLINDSKTISMEVTLDSNTTYFTCISTCKALDGSTLTSPFITYFTTAASFPPYSISGTVLSGTTGVSPENAFVGIGRFNVMQNEDPDFVSFAKVNSNGTYTIPYVPNGTFWPIAAKDVNNDGSIDVESGIDVVAFSDSVVVNGASLTNVDLTFISFSPLNFSEALSEHNNFVQELPNGKQLKTVQAYHVDTLGRATDWDFIYLYDNNTKGSRIHIAPFDNKIKPITDLGWIGGLSQKVTFSNLENAAASGVVMANVENAGGREFRLQKKADSLKFQSSMNLGDLSYDRYWNLNPVPGNFYWGVTYSFGVEGDNQWIDYDTKQFLCDLTTGAVINSGSAKVTEQNSIPNSYQLSQNYPNPFNPVTKIDYQLASGGTVSLKVFDLLGREIAVLVNEVKTAGSYSAQWNAMNIPSGMYFYRLQVTKNTNGAENFVQTKKMMLVK